MAIHRGFILALVLGAAFVGCAHTSDEELALIGRKLAVGTGDTVADVGAGDGDISVALAAVVGGGGRVLATEIDAELREELVERFESAGLEHVVVVSASADSTGLTTACCQGILLRRVYHHLTKPE